jgi:hypothetical protein
MAENMPPRPKYPVLVTRRKRTIRMILISETIVLLAIAGGLGFLSSTLAAQQRVPTANPDSTASEPR